MTETFAARLERQSQESSADLEMLLAVSALFIPPQMKGLRRAMDLVLQEAMEHDAAFAQASAAVKTGDYEGAIRALQQPTFQ